ncbi:MAG: PIN domain-containing protein [Methylobacter sp.]
MILLDTHVWVRWLDPQQKPLAPTLVDVIETADQVAVSAITCWEVA